MKRLLAVSALVICASTSFGCGSTSHSVTTAAAIPSYDGFIDAFVLLAEKRNYEVGEWPKELPIRSIGRCNGRCRDNSERNRVHMLNL